MTFDTANVSDVQDWRNSTWSYSPNTVTSNGIISTSNRATDFSSGTQHAFNSGTQGALPTSASPANLNQVNPRFTDGTGIAGHDDYTLQSTSPLKGAGSSAITAVGAGSSATSLTVTSPLANLAAVASKGLFDGWGIADADWIKIGAGAYVQIASINYSTNVVTLSAARSWNDGDTVIVKGREDVGALPYDYARSFAVTVTTPFGIIAAGPTTLDATCPNPDAVRKVEFFVDGIPVGVAYTPPYSVAWTSDGALHNIEARAYNAWASRTPTARNRPRRPAPPWPTPRSTRSST